MTVTTGRWAANVDALVAAAQAALADVFVCDGPPRGTQGQTFPKRLWVGTQTADPPPAGSTTAGGLAVEAPQVWQNSRGMTRDEVTTVYCIAEGWSGDSVMKTARDLAVSVVAALEVLVRPGPNVSNALGASFMTEIDAVTVDQYQMEAGAFCRVSFAVVLTSYLSQS